MIHYKKLGPETWSDFELLFDKHHGVHGGCWCMYHRLRAKDWQQMSPESRKNLHHSLTMSGDACGLIVYDHEKPVAWCQFGKPSQLLSYDFGRTYPKIDLKEDERPDWRISCLFVDRDHRGQGLATIALEAALTVITQEGGGVVEAFPLKNKASHRPQYTGSLAMYEKHGFEIVQPLTSNTTFLRKKILGY